MSFTKLDLTNVCSSNNRFHIYINNEKTIIYKKAKAVGHIKNHISSYKDIILNTNNTNIRSIKCFDVENNGSYKCEYIKGFTLYQISQQLKTNEEIIQEKSNIIKAIEELKLDLENKIIKRGDWHINNLVYSIEEKKIYNVDCEGYFTYKPAGFFNLEKHLKYIINNL